MTPDEAAARRGSAAEREWKELDAAFDTLREGIVTMLAETSVVHTDKILRLHASLQALTAVRGAIINVVENGQTARVALAALARTGDR